MVMRTGSLALAVMLLSASAAFAAECYSSNLLQRQVAYRFNNKRHAIQDDFHSGRKNDPSASLGNLTPQAFARAGKGPKPTATPSSQAARISGRSRKAPPPSQCGLIHTPKTRGGSTNIIHNRIEQLVKAADRVRRCSRFAAARFAYRAEMPISAAAPIHSAIWQNFSSWLTSPWRTASHNCSVTCH